MRRGARGGIWQAALNPRPADCARRAGPCMASLPHELVARARARSARARMGRGRPRQRESEVQRFVRAVAG